MAARLSRLHCGLDPLNEAAHADLVRQLAAAGDRAGALIAGREVTDRLRAELGVRPGPLLRSALAEARGPGGRAFLAGPMAARRLPGTRRGGLEAAVDPARFPDWWAGIETVRKDAPGEFTQWPTGYPDFPMPQKTAGRPRKRAGHDLLSGLGH